MKTTTEYRKYLIDPQVAVVRFPAIQQLEPTQMCILSNVMFWLARRFGTRVETPRHGPGYEFLCFVYFDLDANQQ